MPDKDYLWLNLRELPYFRALLRAVEAKFYQQIDLSGKVLDLGCGDGHFASIAFDNPLDIGIDPWAGPVREASRREVYRLTMQGNGDLLPFQNSSFDCAVSNSVLEHITQVDAVLAELGRVVKPGGTFVFCVPNHQFLKNLWFSKFLDKIGLTSAASLYRRFFNRISRHYHCDSPEVWQTRLSQAGFEVVRWWHYFSPGAFHTLEAGHYLGFPALILHFFTRRWIAAPYHWNFYLLESQLRKYYLEPAEQPDGAYTFYITRRKHA
jgi:ubiquinone/menaquinone biosynthesis C-methylase UbiE